MGDEASAIIVENASCSPVALLCEALDRSPFWKLVAQSLAQSQIAAGEFHILIKPDLGAFDVRVPTATDPKLVEALIDLLHEKGYPRVDVCAAPDSSFLWAENRDVAVLADLLGYQYVTPDGHEYDMIDLSESLAPADFPVGGVLQGSELAQVWRDAHFRICFAKNKTDEGDAYALCLDSLLGVLSLIDQDYYYRHRLPPGEVVADLLRATPVHFALIDATVSAHGQGGSRAPIGIQTNCVIVSESPLLIDYVGALKMGLDPHQSRLASQVFKSIGLPPNYAVEGNLGVYPGWQNVHLLIIDSHRRREDSPTLSRLLKPWLQMTNPELFPLKHPIDAKVNAKVSTLFADVGHDPTTFWSLVTANYMLGYMNQWLEACRVLYDKDAIRRVHAPLGLQLEDYSEADYLSIVEELPGLEILLIDVEPAEEGLRWRYVDEAIVFEFSRELPIDFDEFVHHVDVAKTIQYMNDYVGGMVVPIKRDADARVLLQTERNLYLPQPNYLALYQGKPIDVSKLEVCEYSATRHRMFWKTIRSENHSAIYDDGIVSFTRIDECTHVRIIGRQLFVLPPFWQMVNLDLAPDIKAVLVTDAYKTFFNRTCANFEALVEGRDIRIGRPWRTPQSHVDTEPLPIEAVERFLINLGEKVQGFFDANGSFKGLEPVATQVPMFVDEDGFKHFQPHLEAAQPLNDSGSMGEPESFQALIEKVSDFYSGLFVSIAHDGLNHMDSCRRIES